MFTGVPIALKFKPFKTSNIWTFRDPDTERVHRASTREALIRLIVSYRAQNGYSEIENLDLVLENYLCTLPQNQGKCRSYFPIQRGLIASLKAGITLLKNLAYKSYAPQSLADSRSEVCVTCPKNQKPDTSRRFIKWTDSIATATIGARRSKEHDNLWNCEVCSCPMRTKVWLPTKDLELKEKELREFPDFCWQKKEYLGKNGKCT